MILSDGFLLLSFSEDRKASHLTNEEMKIWKRDSVELLKSDQGLK